MYTFEYEYNKTNVKNSLGITKTYIFSNKRLHEIIEPYRTIKNQWDQTGQLIWHTIHDRQGNLIHGKNYGYDHNGKITNLVIHGAMTKEGAKDVYGIEYRYTSDDLHLLYEEVHNFGKTYRYTYSPGTNLRTSKISSLNNLIYEREFNEYDQNGILISNVIDDGISPFDKKNLEGVTYRVIREIEPQLDQGKPGLTLPKIIREFYLDPKTGEKHLLRMIERVYGKGGLLIEEKTYDSSGTFAFSHHFDYNDHLELVYERNPLGEITRYQYDNHGNKTWEEKENYKVEYRYNPNNQLHLKLEYHEGKELNTSYQYDAAGQLVMSQDHYGKTTRHEYDDAGHEIATFDSYGFRETKEYDTEGRVIKKVDKEGYATLTSYNMYGELFKVIHPDGTQEVNSYSSEGHLLEKKRRDGSSEKYTLDERGRPIRIEVFSSEKNLIKTLIKEYKGPNLIREIDGMGFELHYEYDGAGRKIATHEGEKTTRFSYDQLGRLAQTLTKESIEVKKYDFLNRIIEERVEDLEGKCFSKEQFQYDIHGNKCLKRTFSTDNEYSETKEFYNSQNRLCTKIDAEGNTTTLHYRDTDHLEIDRIDPLKRMTREVYGSLGELLRVCHLSSKGDILAESNYTYNPCGLKTVQCEKIFYNGLHDGEYKIQTSYDSMGQKLKETEQDLRTTLYTYEKGKLSTLTKADGIVLSHNYDTLGRLSTLISSDGTIHYTYLYDLNNNLIEVKDHVNNTITTRAYNRFQQIIYEKQASGLEISFSYDDLNRPTTVAFQDEKITYKYSPTALISASRYKGNELLYNYHQMCDQKGKLLENSLFGYVLNYSWNKSGHLKTLSSPSFVESLTHDSVGNLVAKNEQSLFGYDESYFSYDDLNQLTCESGPFTHSYRYDSLNNRREKNGDISTLDKLNQVTSQNDLSYKYDPSGRRLSKGDIQYHYDALGRLLSYHDGQNEVSFTYDPFGRRISKKNISGESYYLYQLDTEIALYQNGLKEFRAIFGKHAPFAFEINQKPYFPVRNHRGDIVLLIDGNGTPQSSYRYDSFGNFEHQGISSPWLFFGQRLECGLYHFDKRDYDPHLGLWITPDPAGFADGPNLYAYVKNNPQCYVDPYGLFEIDVKGILHGMGRGTLDNVSCGGTSYLLGDFQPSSWQSKMAYNTTDALLTGASFFFPAKAGFNTAVGAGKWALKSKPIFKAVQVEQSIAKVNTITHVAKESGVIRDAATVGNKVAKKDIFSNLDKLSESGKLMDRGGLTMAGRALDKHGNRPNSPFPKATGNPQSKNNQGQFHLDDILTNPNSQKLIKESGEVQFLSPDGRGAHFYSNGKFRGFLNNE